MPSVAWQVHDCMLCTVIENMGSFCSKQRHNPADSEENAQVESAWFINFFKSILIYVELYNLENCLSYRIPSLCNWET